LNDNDNWLLVECRVADCSGEEEEKEEKKKKSRRRRKKKQQEPQI